ncbi:hypothetical protein WKI13_04680 [Teredinibacter turnerae]|uniref:hypothetical protein n=1 Tax=Teredinibacter turnerae TaxID=2426 RepID=UPI00035C95E0|nr:hypothetical protein [Teredinibacter turnerae]
MDKLIMNYIKCGVISLIISICCNQNVMAFKYNTHVWISQQVIDDLASDGAITIDINGINYHFPVEAQIRDAILENQSIYRMGNIGPDVAPDVAVGQFLIHPGTDSYGTDTWAMNLEDYILKIENRVSDEDWYAYQENLCAQREYGLDEMWGYIQNLSDDDSSSENEGEQSTGEATGSYLSFANELGLLDTLAGEIRQGPIDGPTHQGQINAAELAYHRGFLGHIAGDTFAHSYVNHYSGDVYWLTDGELDVEKRHVAIESYIDKHLPPLPQGRGYNLIESPSEFLANAFIFNRQTAFDIATVDGDFPLIHFLAVERLRAAIRKTASSCVWTGIERFAGQVVINQLTGYTPNENQIQAVNEVLEDANQLNSNFLDELNDLFHKFDSEVRGAYLDHSEKLLNNFDKASGSINTFRNIEEEINNYTDEMADLVTSNACNLERDITEYVCFLWVPDPKPLNPGHQKCAHGELQIITPSCATHTTYQTFMQARDDLIASRDNDLDVMVNAIRSDIENLRDSMVAIHDAKNSVENLINYLAAFQLDSLDPFKNALKRWDQNITTAMIAWIDANAEGAKNAMIAAENPVEESDRDCYKLFSGIGDCLAHEEPVLDPLIDWFGIYGPSLIGIPSEMTIAMRDVGTAFSSIRSLVDGTARTAHMSSSDPISRFLLTMVEKNISQNISSIDVVEEIVKFVGDEEQEKLYEDAMAIFSLKIDDEIINRQFAIDESEKGLVKYRNFADQLRKDMKIGSDGIIDTDRFSALKNAVTLSKLTLLNDAQLNQVASLAGIQLPAYAPYNPRNIIYGAIKNIDGHEQWRPKGHPLPRDGTNFYETSKAAEDPYNNIFGRYIDSGESGFRFWQGDQNASNFNKLFQMPLHEDGGLDPAVLVVIINSILL